MACAVAADVPTQYGKVSFVLQRGGALQYTDAVNVDTERKAYWNEVLKLVGSYQVFFGLKLAEERIDSLTHMPSADSYNLQSVKQDVA